MKKSLLIIISLVVVIGLVVTFYLVSQNKEEIKENKLADIEITNFLYTPANLTIKVGTTLTWINNDAVVHTVTSEEGEELSSQNLAKGDSYTHAFTKVGVYNYYCIPHPWMKGQIIVEE